MFPISEPLTDLQPLELNYEVTFPASAWNPFYFGYLVLAEFAKTAWQHIDLGDMEPPTDEYEIFQEIENLAGPDWDLRFERADEILDQAASFTHYFAQALMLSPQSHPKTLALIEAADQVGLMVAMHYKFEKKRGRPHQVFPSLVPLIPWPMHPSWPSGHSLESHMIALALAEVVPSAQKMLVALADRIGKNREIAGVHYRSDTIAGKEIARKVYPFLQRCAKFGELVDGARAEHAPDGAATP